VARGSFYWVVRSV